MNKSKINLSRSTIDNLKQIYGYVNNKSIFYSICPIKYNNKQLISIPQTIAQILTR